MRQNRERREKQRRRWTVLEDTRCRGALLGGIQRVEIQAGREVPKRLAENEEGRVPVPGSSALPGDDCRCRRAEEIHDAIPSPRLHASAPKFVTTMFRAASRSRTAAEMSARSSASRSATYGSLPGSGPVAYPGCTINSVVPG